MKRRGKLDVYLSRIGDLGNLGASGHDGAAVPLPRKLYRVSEIADHLGVTRQTLHNYAVIGLITEERRTDGGQRLFDESVFTRLAIIQRLKRSHRLHEIRRMMEEGAAGRGSGIEAAEPLSSRSREVAGGRELAPAFAAQRTSLERMQELAAAAHLSDEIETAAARPVAGLPHKSPPEEVAGHSAPSPHISGEAVEGPDVAVRVPFGPSTGTHEDQAPTDDKAQS
ncbi:MAG: MerR family transcriptional regulator [Planctomycetota bacterium]|nr:MerR family transcriptional regulator [Planctomycetota bacterium]